MGEQLSEITVLSYNIFVGRAQDHFEHLQESGDYDFALAQECHPTEMPADIGVNHPARLAANTTIGRYGLALYYKDQNFDLLHRETPPLQLSQSEQLFPHTRSRQRVLIAQFRERQTRRKITIANLHASQSFTSTATNRTRLRQIEQTIDLFSLFPDSDLELVVGDINWFMPTKRLERYFEKKGFIFLKPKQSTNRTFGMGFTIDMGAARFASEGTAEVLPSNGESDHQPVRYRIIFGTKSRPNMTEKPKQQR